jgi:hypothetical protein
VCVCVCVCVCVFWFVQALLARNEPRMPIPSPKALPSTALVDAWVMASSISLSLAIRMVKGLRWGATVTELGLRSAVPC